MSNEIKGAVERVIRRVAEERGLALPALRDDTEYGTTLIEGNWDAVSGEQDWSVPSVALPNSLYLSQKPAWFGALSWPPVDAELEIVRGQPRDRLAIAIEGADVYLNHVNRRLETLS